MVACISAWSFFKETDIKPEDVELQPFRNDTLETRIGTTKYYESIAESEREFKILLDLIDEYELTDDTIVIYASDHGMHEESLPFMIVGYMSHLWSDGLERFSREDGRPDQFCGFCSNDY